MLLLLGILALAMVLLSGPLLRGTQQDALQYSEVLGLFENEQVESFVLQGTELSMTLTDGTDKSAKIGSPEQFHSDLDTLIAEQSAKGTLKSYDYPPVVTPWLETALPYILGGLGLLLLFFFLMSRTGGGPASAGFYSPRNV